MEDKVVRFVTLDGVELTRLRCRSQDFIQ